MCVERMRLGRDAEKRVRAAHLPLLLRRDAWPVPSAGTMGSLLSLHSPKASVTCSEVLTWKRM